MNITKRFMLALSSLTFATTLALAQTTPPPSSDQPGTDTWITTKVKSELATTQDVKSMDISVKTVNGVVYLSGTQPSDTAVKKAVTATKSVKGVLRVDSSGLKTTGT